MFIPVYSLSCKANTFAFNGKLTFFHTRSNTIAWSHPGTDPHTIAIRIVGMGRLR